MHLSAKANVALVVVSAVIVAALSSSIGDATTATTSTGSATNGGWTRLHAVPRLPDGTRTLGALGKTTSLRVSVVLASRDPAGLAAEAEAVSTPDAPVYDDFLTAGQAAADFGPAAGVTTAVDTWLRHDGLSVSSAIGDGLVIPASGPASAVEAAFGTPLDDYQLPSGVTRYANTTDPEIPTGLAGTVSDVVGLNNLGQFHSNAISRRLAKRTLSTAKVHPHDATTQGASTDSAPTPCSQLTAYDGATANELETLYDGSPIYAAGLTGAGVTIGLIEGGESLSTNDVAVFNACYGTTVAVTPMPVDGGCSSCQVGEETMLDVETAMGFAPGAAVDVYQAPDLSDESLLDDISTAVSDDQAKVISESIGECEPDVHAYDPTFSSNENTQFELMAAQGQSMFASSGDEGSEACLPDTGGGSSDTSAYVTQLAVSDPASQPYVTAVGGTSVPSLTDPSAQTVWNSGPYPTWSGNYVTSGGISTSWTMPSWQVGFDMSGLSSGVPCGASSGEDCREVPDVAASADPDNNGYLTIEKCPKPSLASFSECTVYLNGGTSLSSPMWAAFAALADQEKVATTGAPLGFLNPSLYATDSAHPASFTDITSGNDDYLSATNDYTASGGDANDTCTYGSSTDQPCYEATTGFDMATGLGTPVLASLFAYLVAPSITTTSLRDATEGVPYLQTLTALGGTLSYSWSVAAGDSLPEGLSLDSATGTISGTPGVAATKTFTVQATDANGTVASASESITVNVVPAIATSSLPVGLQGQPYVVNLTGDGGTGPLTWSLAGGGALPTGLSLNSSTGEISGTPSIVGDTPITIDLTDANGAAATPLSTSIDIEASIEITTSSLPTATVGAAYAASLNHAGGTAPLAWSVTAGSLPSGLEMNTTTGQISGDPITSGVFAFTAQVVDAYSTTTSLPLSIDVNPPVQIATSAPPTGAVGSSYSVALSATGGTSPIAWSLAVGSALPPGLDLSSSTGQITGTPTASGTTTFTVVATDSNGSAGDASITIEIASAPTMSTTPSSPQLSTPSPATLTPASITVSAPAPLTQASSHKVSSSSSAIGATPDAVIANGSSRAMLTVTLRTASGAEVSGKSVSLVASGGASSIRTISSKTDRSGAATFTVSDRSPQTVTYRATDATDHITLARTVTVHFVPAIAISASRSTIAASAVSRSCPIGARASITVALRTRSGSSAATRSIVLSAPRGFRGTLTPASAMTGMNGSATFSIRDGTRQQVTVTVRDATDQVTLGSVNLSFPKRSCA